MKKLLILITILVASNSLMAQKKSNFGMKTGLNLAALKPGTSFSPNSEYETSAKFLLGMFANFKMGKGTLQPGFNFSVKGNKSVEQYNLISFGSPVPYTIERNMNISYLELPINLLYDKALKLGTFYYGGGPYAAYALGGRIRSTEKRNIYVKDASKEDLEFGDQAGQLKTGDYGLNLTTGFRLKNGMDFGANYGFGLANISNDAAFTSRNRQLSFSIGYLF